MSDTTNNQRRNLLKGTAGILATGMFPAVHAQEKITLRYLGTAVNQDKAIAEKFKADTGITIQYVAVNTDEVTKRAVTSPNSFDLIDTEYFSLKKIVPTGNLKGIDVKRIKNADKITSLFTTGLFHQGGVVGAGGSTRMASPFAFAGAPRYHGGGIAGLAADEMPAILRRGEEVLTAGDPRHRSNGGLASGATVVQNIVYQIPPGQSPAAYAAALEANNRRVKAEAAADAQRPGRTMNRALHRA